MRIRSLFLFRRYPITTFIILLFVFALILISLRIKQRSGVEWLDSTFMEICSPFQRISSYPIKVVQKIIEEYVFLLNIRKENEALKRRILELERENNQLKEMALANARLKSLLDFKEKISTSVIAAEVIARDPTSWFKSITINRGERDGVKKGMAVISPKGVVGHILKTSPNSSVVLLITDYNSAIDSIVQRTRAKAIVEGLGENRCQLKYLLKTEDVSIGDVVVTSGLGGNFPKGLMIGEIKKVDNQGYGIFKYAELVPSVDIPKLEEVLIVKESFSFISEERIRNEVQKPKRIKKGKK